MTVDGWRQMGFRTFRAIILRTMRSSVVRVVAARGHADGLWLQFVKYHKNVHTIGLCRAAARKYGSHDYVVHNSSRAAFGCARTHRCDAVAFMRFWFGVKRDPAARVCGKRFVPVR